MAGKIDNLEMEQFFLALADRTRLRLLNLMGEDEVCVCYLVEVLKEPQPKISRHLAYLRRPGLWRPGVRGGGCITGSLRRRMRGRRVFWRMS
ncbi:MAG: ArsR/SmtB family transcription factor [Acidobacteriota bacterium]